MNYNNSKRRSEAAMGDTQSVPGMSANLKKAVCWIGETVREHPKKARKEIINEAELRFDLTPRECEFLNQNFLELAAGNPS